MNVEHQLQQILMQRQQLTAQKAEIESALSELSGDAYKIIGNIMVSTSEEKLRRELEEKKKLVELRLQSLEKQEAQLQKKAETTSEE